VVSFASRATIVQVYLTLACSAAATWHYNMAACSIIVSRFAPQTLPVAAVADAVLSSHRGHGMTDQVAATHWPAFACCPSAWWHLAPLLRIFAAHKTTTTACGAARSNAFCSSDILDISRVCVAARFLPALWHSGHCRNIPHASTVLPNGRHAAGQTPAKRRHERTV